jgi:lysozyme
MTLNGIDVSASGQGDSFSFAPYRNKIAFAGVKVSEGVTYADPDAARNIAGARSLGIPVLAYHFLHAGLSGSGQAGHFLELAAKASLKPGTDIIVIDAEDGGLDGEDPSQMNAAAAAFHGELDRHFPNYHPLVYTEISMGPHLTSMGNCPLWLANPSGAVIKSIGPWNLVSFEQTGQRGVDTDVFYGSAADLAKLAFSK